eukprot:267128_1
MSRFVAGYLIVALTFMFLQGINLVSASCAHPDDSKLPDNAYFLGTCQDRELCAVTCHPGFKKSGDGADTLRCDSDSDSWEGTLRACTKGACPWPIDLVDNLKYTAAGSSSCKDNPGSCTGKCADGYASAELKGGVTGPGAVNVRCDLVQNKASAAFEWKWVSDKKIKCEAVSSTIIYQILTLAGFGLIILVLSCCIMDCGRSARKTPQIPEVAQADQAAYPCAEIEGPSAGAAKSMLTE